MFLENDSILEVDQLSKLYARSDSGSRSRMAKIFTRALFLRAPKAPKDLKKDEFWSLKDVSFSLKRGEAIGVIGMNGAGKTTLLKILSGQILPDEGEVRIVGDTAAMIDITAGFSAVATGRQNIFLRGAALGHSKQFMTQNLDSIIEFSELEEAIDAPFATYSAGMKMRLAFSIMIISQPDILFIDEVLSVGDFRFQQKCLAKIREIRENVAFVLVSHSMSNIKLFCTKAIVLNKGDVVFSGSPDEAITVYEDMQLPEKVSKDEIRKTALSPQFRNDNAIKDIKHFWCDATGSPIKSVKSGDDLYFSLTFIPTHTPKNLIIGIPIWNEGGVYITGFSTEVQEKKFSVKADTEVTFILKIPHLGLNPGVYISNIAISDGLEFLCRSANPSLEVIRSRPRFWGVVSLPHSWTISR